LLETCIAVYLICNALAFLGGPRGIMFAVGKVSQETKTDVTNDKVTKTPDLPKSERTLGNIACQEKSG